MKRLNFDQPTQQMIYAATNWQLKAMNDAIENAPSLKTTLQVNIELANSIKNKFGALLAGIIGNCNLTVAEMQIIYGYVEAYQFVCMDLRGKEDVPMNVKSQLKESFFVTQDFLKNLQVWLSEAGVPDHLYSDPWAMQKIMGAEPKQEQQSEKNLSYLQKILRNQKKKRSGG